MGIDDERLIAFADGELGPDDRAAVEAALAGDPTLRDRLAREERLRALVSGHYAPVADEPVPERLKALLTPPAEIVDLAARREARQARARPLWQNFAALAATLVLGLFAGRTLLPGAAGPVGLEEGVLVAQGGLADALETQLASSQAADAETRIGVSFAAADGRLCRTFASAAASGLACRDAGHWRLVTVTGGQAAPSGEVRQAASAADPLVLEAAQAMMAGEPLDAAGERRARASGWRSGPAAD